MAGTPRDYNLDDMKTYLKKFEEYVSGVESSAKKLISDTTSEMDANNAKLVKGLLTDFNETIEEFLKVPKSMVEFMTTQVKRTEKYDATVNG